MKQIRKRLTYANVMSSIAVFLILGGATAVAAKKIGTNQLKASSVTTGKIKKGSITTTKIKDNAVTGAKVDEGSLGEVPNAANAKKAATAGTAASANTVNGVLATKINYGANSVSGPQTIFSQAGLVLTAECTGSNVIEVNATTSVANSSIYTTVVDTDANNNNTNADEESGEFQPGENFDLLATHDGNPALVTFEYDNNGGATATGTISVDEDNVAGAGCQAHGVVFSG